MTPVLRLAASVQGLVLDAGLNGASLLRHGGSPGLSSQLPVNQWILPGVNYLTARVAPTSAGSGGCSCAASRSCESAARAGRTLAFDFRTSRTPDHRTAYGLGGA